MADLPLQFCTITNSIRPPIVNRSNTDHAQAGLGDPVFVEVPSLGQTLAGNERCVVVESMKAASDLYSPIASVVTACNEALAQAPDMANQDPYGGGWITRMRPADTAALAGLLSANDHQALLAAE